MKLMHVTIQTDKFEKEIEFYEKFAGLKVMQDMRPYGKEYSVSRRGQDRYLH